MHVVKTAAKGGDNGNDIDVRYGLQAECYASFSTWDFEYNALPEAWIGP